jgi:XisI protein
MDKLNTYRKIIKEVLTRYYELDLEQPSTDLETVLALDEVRDQYFWVQVGWNQNQRTCGSTVYIRIKDEKVWVEEDLTEDGVTNDLLEAGIPKHDIVLGFQHPRERALTEFAVA